MKIVFADTFYYLALLNPGDNRHQQALACTATLGGRMLTTSWVVMELGDALASPSTRSAFLQTLGQLRSDPAVTVLPPESASFEEGLKLYAARPDKEWSLTDCISFVVMQREGITEALTGDHHFEQAGFVALLK
jgi:predicted nucleic acid-binding protein